MPNLLTLGEFIVSCAYKGWALCLTPVYHDNKEVLLQVPLVFPLLEAEVVTLHPHLPHLLEILGRSLEALHPGDLDPRLVGVQAALPPTPIEAYQAEIQHQVLLKVQ